MSDPRTTNLVKINISGHLLKMRNGKSSVFSPRIMNLVKIIVLTVLRNIFNGIYVVSKSLEHDREYISYYFLD